MDSYDAIIYGADLQDIISAVFTIKKNKSVLLVNPNKRVGDNTEHFIKRRFTFERIENTLLFLDDDQVAKLLQGLDINIDFITPKDLIHVIAISKENSIKREYVLPMGINAFTRQIEEYIPGSKNSVSEFFNLAQECEESLAYVLSNPYNSNEIKHRFPNFVKLVNKSVSEVLDYLDMPLKAQEIINACWIFFGTPETELSFIDYSILLYNFVRCNTKVPKKGLEYLNSKLLKTFLKLGGNYINGLTLDKIVVLEKQVTGVLFANEIYYTNNFITNINPSKIYNSLIEKDAVPKEGLQLSNKRTAYDTPFTIYIGLNRSPKELNITSSRYLIYNSLDSDVEYNKMSNINNNNSIVTINTLINSSLSLPGTTNMTIETYFFKNCFGDLVNIKNYNDSIDDITNNLVSSFEEKTGIRIRDYIEEITIFSPVDYLNKYKDSSYFGYKLSSMDNSFIRYVNREHEEFINGLHFYGKYGIFGSPFGNTLLTSKIIADRIAKE